MKKLLLTALSFVVAASALFAQTTIYAYRSFQQSNGILTKKGPVKYSSDNPRNTQLIADQTKLGSVYAGAYYNYKWYVQVTQPGTQSTVEGWYIMDLNDGSRTYISSGGAHLAELDYDYTTGNMYGIKNGCENLLKVDKETGATSSLGYFRTESYQYLYMLTLAIDLNGQMYGIDTGDNFYKIDKTNAVCTLVGNTGANAAYTQSMTFDHNSGTLYWANNGDYGLYTIDLATGKATLIGVLGENGDDSTCAMIIPYINVAKGAPDRVTNRKATVDGKSVVLSWTNPSIDAQGNALAELTGVKIYRGEELVATVAASADNIGKNATYTDANLADGLYKYRIVAVNSKGDGGADTETIDSYVGMNNPGPVNDFKIELGDNNATLSWTAPTKGMYGGEYDVNSVTKYIITRTAGSTSTEIEVTNATSYTDTPGFGKYTYSIAAVNNMGRGQETSVGPVLVKPSNWILMSTGEAVVETGKEYQFYDVAGPNNYYPNSQNDTLVIRPAVANAAVKAEFTLFDFDTYADSLIVFNGVGTKAPLIGRYSSMSVPSDLVEVESTSADGALTFVFFSDVMSRGEGWVAKVTATEKLSNDLAAKALSGNLYPEVSAETTYALNILNKGTEAVVGSAYKVKLVDANNATLAEANGVDIAPTQTGTVELKFAPAATGEMSISAVIEYAADKNTANNQSAPITLSVLQKGSKFVEVGHCDEELYVVPVSFMSDECASQVIYYAEEIGVKDMDLTMISYPFYEVTTNYANVPIKVWVTEIDSTSLEVSSIPANKMTLVFEGNCPVATGAESWDIPFNTPYKYTGRNLVVMIYKKAPGTSDYGVTFRGTYGDYNDVNKRARYGSAFFEDESVDVNANLGYSGNTTVTDIKMLFTQGNSSSIKEVVISNNVKVFPNPTTSVLNLTKEVAKAELVALSGQMVFCGENVTQIDVEALPAGIYVLKTIDAEGAISTTKVIKK